MQEACQFYKQEKHRHCAGGFVSLCGRHLSVCVSVGECLFTCELEWQHHLYIIANIIWDHLIHIVDQ